MKHLIYNSWWCIYTFDDGGVILKVTLLMSSSIDNTIEQVGVVTTYVDDNDDYLYSIHASFL